MAYIITSVSYARHYLTPRHCRKWRRRKEERLD